MLSVKAEPFLPNEIILQGDNPTMQEPLEQLRNDWQERDGAIIFKEYSQVLCGLGIMTIFFLVTYSPVL